MARMKGIIGSPLFLFSLASFSSFLLGFQAISREVVLTVSLSVVTFFLFSITDPANKPKSHFLISPSGTSQICRTWVLPSR